MSGITEKRWRDRALMHYDETSWLACRVVEAEGLKMGEPGFGERVVEVITECQEALATENAAHVA